MARTAYLFVDSTGERRFGWFVLDAMTEVSPPQMMFLPLDHESGVVDPSDVRDGRFRIVDRKPAPDVLENE